MVTQQFREASAEIVEILKNIDINELEKIPYKTRAIFLKYRDFEYNPKINLNNNEFDEINLKKKTKDILVWIYLNYWCTDEEKEEIESLLIQNYEINQISLREKYNIDDIFKNKKQIERNKDNMYNTNDDEKELMTVKYNESIFKRIINKIKDILKIDS